jgi:VWFA-related protein
MPRAFILCFIAAVFCHAAPAAAQSEAVEFFAAQPGPAPESSGNRVVVDVVVTDSVHHPIHNLRASDFRLFEDARPQAIETFEEHSSREAVAPPPASPNLFAGAFTNFTIAPVHGALNILVLDLLNTPEAARSELRSRMIRALQQVHPGTRIAILGLTTRLVLLQGFATDPQLLSSVLTAKHDPAPVPTAADAPRSHLGNDPGTEQIQAGLQLFMTDLSALPYQARARYTLDAINQLARSLGVLPGRKNLIWVSSSFPIDLMPDGNEPTPFAAVASAEDEYRDTVDRLTRGQVSVYPIDAGNNAVAQSDRGDNPNAKYIRGPVSHSHNPADLYQLTAEEPGVMQAMAEATGGESIALTGELNDAVERAIDRGSSYYTLTYTPSDRALNGAYRRIHVDVVPRELVLAYRRGYFANDSKTAQAPTAQRSVHAESQRPYRPFDAAMTLAAPVPTEMIVAATVSSLTSSDKAGGQAKSPFRRYAIQLGIEARNMICPATPDGIHQCTLDLSIAAYDASGASINLAGGVVQANMAAGQYDSTPRPELSFHQDVSVPIASLTFLRIGVRDRGSGKIGAVELPLAQIGSLPPANNRPDGKDQSLDHEKTPPAGQL